MNARYGWSGRVLRGVGATPSASGSLHIRTPSFPVQSSAAAPTEERVVGTAGTIVPAAVAATPRSRRTTMETIARPPRGNQGVWLDFVGTRWYSSGVSTSYAPDRFTKVGEYRGFPVYVESVGKKDTIWVQVTKGGPLAPYSWR